MIWDSACPPSCRAPHEGGRAKTPIFAGHRFAHHRVGRHIHPSSRRSCSARGEKSVMQRSCLRKNRVLCASRAVYLPMESTTLTFPHTVGRQDVLTHGSRSALADYTVPFCSHIAFR